MPTPCPKCGHTPETVVIEELVVVAPESKE
jgi:hypothetical protein